MSSTMALSSMMPIASSSPKNPTPNDDTVEAETINTYFALLLSVLLLYFILGLSYLLLRKKVRIVHETVISIVLGMVIGAILLASNSQAIMKLVSFDSDYFFNLLLPPIILNSGYDMHRKNFFRNLGTILSFALLGTFVSTIVIGIFLFALIKILGLGLTSSFSFLDCIIVGSILSSTDPVTILSLFQQLRVDPKLYTVIFGESLLNDSVAIVLFSTLGQLRGKEMNINTISSAMISFVSVLGGSVLIGIFAGLSFALLLKYSKFNLYPSLETCLFILQAYSSYLLSSALKFSGIVSLLFCGMVLKHYAYDNLSKQSQNTTKNMLRVLSQLSENFVFIYLGMTLFTRKDLVFYPLLIFFTILILLGARFLSVIPISRLINKVHSVVNPDDLIVPIPVHHQYMIWWSGLRGAIAFALSYQAVGDNRPAVQSTILVVCVVSVVVLGGMTPFVMEWLGIKTGGELQIEQEECGAEYGLLPGTSMETMDDGYNDDDDDILPCSPPQHWFMSFDSQILKPFFTKPTSFPGSISGYRYSMDSSN